MFIGVLNEEQQSALCRIVQYIASVDGVFDAREAALTRALAAESSLGEIPSTAVDLDEVESLLKAFDTPIARRALLLESIGVALADQVVHPKEIEVINAMAGGLDLTEEWVEGARDYVQRALDLQHEGQDLLVG